MKTALSSKANQDYCNLLDELKTTQKMFDVCNNFCGQENIPLLVGAQGLGFNKSAADFICLGHQNTDGFFGNFDSSRITTCRQANSAVADIKRFTAILVTDLEVLKYSKLQYKATVLTKVKELAEEVSTEEFQKQFRSMHDRDKIGAYRAALSAKLEGIMRSGTERYQLTQALQQFGTTAKNLKNNLDRNIGYLDGYGDKCARPVTGLGPHNEYLFDICTQDGDFCIEHADSKHISCCCGVLPASGTTDIPAKEVLSGNVPATVPGASAVLDVCAEAEVKTTEALKPVKEGLQKTATGKALLEEYEAKKATDQWQTKCARRLQQQLNMTFDNEKHLHREVSQSERARRLAVLTACSPEIYEQPKRDQSATDPSLVVSMFLPKAQVEFCPKLTTDAGQQWRTTDMVDVCDKFCGAEAVPLLVGSTEFGFNRSALDEVCIDSDIVKTDTAALNTCKTKVEALNVVPVKMAAFISAVISVEYKLLVLQAAVAAMVPKIRELLIKPEVEDQLRRARDRFRIGLYESILRQALDAVSGAEAYPSYQLKLGLQKVEQTAKDLQAAVDKAVADFDYFLANCADFYTGKGSLSEYMLDICAQRSDVCLNDPIGPEDARHAGCCCAYTPHMAIGQYPMPVHTVPGMKAFKSNSRSRRLEGLEYSICGEAYTMALPAIREAESKLTEYNQAQVLDELLAKLRTQYPNGKWCKASQIPTPTPTSGSPTPSSSPEQGPSGGSVDGAKKLTCQRSNILLTLIVLLSYLPYGCAGGEYT